MDNKDCNTCKNSSNKGLNIFGIHICRDCLKSIEKLEVGAANYDYYKNIIARAWKNNYRLKTN